MTRRLPAPALLLPLLLAVAAPAGGSAVGRIAVEHGVEDWLQTGEETDLQLAALRGKVVLLHTFAWDSEPCTRTLIPLVNDLVRANRDRELAAVSICASDDEGGDASARPTRLHMTHAVGVAKEGECPYLVPGEGGIGQLFLVGRSGLLLWRGDPVREQEAFLEAVRLALGQPAAPCLERDLRPELGEACAEYCAGRYGLARSLAEKVRGRFEEAAGEEAEGIAADAEHLIGLVSRLEQEHLDSARDALVKHRSMRFMVSIDVLSRGFPKTRSSRLAQEMVKESVRGRFAGSFRDARDWFEIRGERPPLFPARRDREGDRFAREIEKYLRKTHNDVGATQEARRLMEAYEAVD